MAKSISQFQLPYALKQHILQHALATPELEVCGLISSINQIATSVYQIPNIASDPAHAFYMQPEAQVVALKTMRQRNEHLSGIYHSHPKSEALPSAKDLQQAAYIGTAYLIISLITDQPKVGSFIFDGQTFQPLTLHIS